jgi:hypothetical protein
MVAQRPTQQETDWWPLGRFAPGEHSKCESIHRPFIADSLSPAFLKGAKVSSVPKTRAE